MTRQRFLLALLLILIPAYAMPACAQGPRHAHLSEAESEAVREASVYPAIRVKLYTKYLDERADTIRDLISRPRSGARVLKLDELLKDFTALMDEMGDNLDQYADRHSDIRKALKPLNESAPRWVNILKALPGESGFDLARKEAIETGEELSDQVKRLMQEQTEYFAVHKDEKDQERNDDAVKPEHPK